ncbi:hypothetical protein D018_1988A, partial [Vibrio parahaemolyticus VP2007-007]
MTYLAIHTTSVDK